MRTPATTSPSLSVWTRRWRAFERLCGDPRQPGILAPISSWFGNVEIRVTARRAMVDARKVRLTPKEFDRLRFLVSNDDVPLAHDRIPRVFIKQLRKSWSPVRAVRGTS
jgi:hypothetical protein